MFTTQKLLPMLLVAAFATSAAPAAAADTVIVPLDAASDVQQMTALDGLLVWSTGDRLMQRDRDGRIEQIAQTPGATYRSIDLGVTGSGRVVLTYLRCGGPRAGCAAWSDDLAGDRTRFERLAPRRCAVTTAPARWLSRVAYGLSCTRLHGPPGVVDPRRSGVYVRMGKGPAQRQITFAFGLSHPFRVSTVDLRGKTAGAVVTSAAWFDVNAGEIDTGESAGLAHSPAGLAFDGGMSVGSGGALWALILGTGTDTHAELRRTSASGCPQVEPLPNTPASIQSHGYPAEAMASDGNQVHLFVRGTGIVTHVFNPTEPCF